MLKPKDSLNNKPVPLISFCSPCSYIGKSSPPVEVPVDGEVVLVFVSVFVFVSLELVLEELLQDTNKNKDKNRQDKCIFFINLFSPYNPIFSLIVFWVLNAEDFFVSLKYNPTFLMKNSKSSNLVLSLVKNKLPEK